MLSIRVAVFGIFQIFYETILVIYKLFKLSLNEPKDDVEFCITHRIALKGENSIFRAKRLKNLTVLQWEILLNLPIKRVEASKY